MLFKARFRLRGDRKVAYRYFDQETIYAPVVCRETIRILLAKVAAQDLILEGIDVAAAYLHGELKKPVMMDRPTNSSDISFKPNHLSLVVKSNYGHCEEEIYGAQFRIRCSSDGDSSSTRSTIAFSFFASLTVFLYLQ